MGEGRSGLWGGRHGCKAQNHCTDQHTHYCTDHCTHQCSHGCTHHCTNRCTHYCTHRCTHHCRRSLFRGEAAAPLLQWSQPRVIQAQQSQPYRCGWEQGQYRCGVGARAVHVWGGDTSNTGEEGGKHSSTSKTGVGGGEWQVTEAPAVHTVYYTGVCGGPSTAALALQLKAGMIIVGRDGGDNGELVQAD